MAFDLTVLWAGIIGFAIFAYVVMDGFDLGIGILFPLFDVGDERDQAMNSIAPVWDGNETWLVLGGGGLLAAFPLAYAIILPATYPLIIAMLLGLVFRGVAFEFRWRDPRHRAFWDLAFSAGSIIAAMAQGMVLGALLQGIEVDGRAYAGSWWDWLTPYTLLTGIGTMAGYALLGSTWLNWKTEGGCQHRARRIARIAAFATLALMAAVSLANLALDDQYRERWLSMPELALAAPLPLLSAVLGLMLLRDLAGKRREARPFLLALGLFLLGTLGLGFTIWPYAVPFALTIWETAAPHRSQSFMLVGVGLTLPLILAYTGWAYWIFRGKVGTHGYH